MKSLLEAIRMYKSNEDGKYHDEIECQEEVPCRQHQKISHSRMYMCVLLARIL